MLKYFMKVIKFTTLFRLHISLDDILKKKPWNIDSNINYPWVENDESLHYSTISSSIQVFIPPMFEEAG